MKPPVHGNDGYGWNDAARWSPEHGWTPPPQAQVHVFDAQMNTVAIPRPNIIAGLEDLIRVAHGWPVSS